MVKTIDMTPTWTATAQMITTVVKHGTGDKEGICEEILKMGKLLDFYQMDSFKIKYDELKETTDLALDNLTLHIESLKNELSDYDSKIEDLKIK